MSTTNPQEVWQVEVGGQVYEAPFAELGDWIGEGSLQPDDKVRKGNLRWIEARLVPGLVPFFNAKEQGVPLPVLVNTTEATGAGGEIVHSAATHNFPSPESPPVIPAEPAVRSTGVDAEGTATAHDPNFCAVHTELPSVFVCGGCGTGFCKVCPEAYGGSVRICPFCGALCRLMKEVVQKRAETEKRVAAIDQGFGTSDFFRALAHPFKFKASLFFGAVMFAAVSVGQSVTALGGIYMMVSALFCLMLANMLTFGVLANTIDKFAHGDLEANFMPSFDDFELWDDVVHPLFLSIGAYLSAFGPFAIVLTIGLYIVTSSVNTQMNSFQQSVEKIPGTHYYDAQRTVEQSEAVKQALGNVASAHNQQLEDADRAARGETESKPDESVSDRETREQEELWAAAQNSRKQELESVLGKAPDTRAKESEAMLQSFLALPAPLVVIGAIFFLWGAFYFPAACAVAGYTRSFMSTINPLVGLDTIKRLGGTYVKILLMSFVLVLASWFIGSILGAVLGAFDLPGMGNLPAKFIGSLFGFYLSVVFSCVIGYAMFKKSDALAIKP
ncbi:MAG TPA: hypothetical protein VMZ26_08415 [Pyrinomonadaceae bacterium]|nr:hypothetical protein [Pyrinomonadaceae bacterium]